MTIAAKHHNDEGRSFRGQTRSVTLSYGTSTTAQAPTAEVAAGEAEVVVVEAAEAVVAAGEAVEAAAVAAAN